VVATPGVAIPDTEPDLNWHAFLGHSIDMQGFRAGEFVGVDRLTKSTASATPFTPLRSRGIGVPELAALWAEEPIRDHLLHGVPPGTPMASTYAVLRQDRGPTGASLAEAFEVFPWRKGHWCVRALLENSAKLEPDGWSFRRWLARECRSLGVDTFPPPDFRRGVNTRSLPSKPARSLEQGLRARLERSFYRVGPAMAAYMLCDWQLGLWLGGRTRVFDTFKLDSFHESFVKRHAVRPELATEDGFASWWHRQGGCEHLPPRLANECIWLEVESKSRH
jgi:hypothetical protein